MLASPLAVEIRRGAVESLRALLADRRISAEGHVAVVVGSGQGEDILALLRPTLDNADAYAIESASVDGARDVAASLRSRSYDAVVGIGGGRTLDVAKYAATLAGLPMVAVATNLAHDGLASPVASLEQDGRKGSYGVQIPLAVVVDLDYVDRAPPEQIRSGIGDALSNASALADWELAQRERNEPADGLATAFARTAATSVMYRADGVEADGFLTALAEALVLSGLAMVVAGSSRPCSGACHEISHAIDALYPGSASHGEQVAVGALFASFLRGADDIEALDAALRRHRVARLPADLGLDLDAFAAAVAHAPGTRPDRYTILEHLRLSPDEIRTRVAEFVDAFDR